MADSKHANLGDDGLIVAAMAYRVKYRKVNSAGQAKMIPVRVESMGVHMKNRGGVYPAGIRCKGLCADVVVAGFVKEEVNHACVAVEEIPVDEIIRSRGAGMVSGSTFNAENSSKDDLLCTCFQAPYDDVRHMLLSHNHMMLVMRAFLTQAKWDLPAEVERNIISCDSDGRLPLTAVAASTNGRELAEVIAEGLQAEVLSWRMDLEEPNAASIISQALNQPAQMAMRATELTAVAVLQGEIIIVQMSKDVSQCVAFQTVRGRVRSQLHTAADDPDLPEVFDFLISAGVGKNSYIDHLLEWTTCFVDSKKRQLRFSAFAVVNKMCEQAVWSRIAVVKRAYRKHPNNGFCPSPEAAWGGFSWAHLQKLEDVLRFFHVVCKAILDKITPQSRIKLLANIDIAAAETFWAAKDPKLKYGEQKIQELLLEKTQQYLAPLGLEEDEEKLKSMTGRANWILFKKDAEQPQAKTTAMEPNTAPKVIQFDEITGAQLNQQLDFPAQASMATVVKLPWRQWRSGIGSSLGDTEAYKSSAVAVLNSLHVNFAVDLEPIELWQHKGSNYVTATCIAKPGDIMLPPCVPKQSKVLERSEHPFAVEMTLRVVRPTETQVGDDTASRRSTFFLNPELKTPKHEEVNAAVAEAKGGDDVTDDAAVAEAKGGDEWTGGPLGDHTMHPFWAVRRMTQQQLAREIANAKEGTRRPRFNCRLEGQNMSCVNVGIVKSQSVTTTRVFHVPFLTNSIEVHEGEELILEVREKTQNKMATKRTWKHAFQDQARKEEQTQKHKQEGSQ